MNKTVIFITFAALAALGVIGTMILLIHRPDASATFTSFIVTILGLVSVAAGTFYGFGKQGEKLETIAKQTNGNLSKQTDENKRLTDIIIAAGLSPNLTTGEIATITQTKPRAPGDHASSAPIQ